MWIARDLNNQLFVFTEKPIKNEYDLVFDGGECLELNDSEYPEVTWENSPIEIKTVSNKGISIDWEQRRYEIAKDAMNALVQRQSAKDAAEGQGISFIQYASEMAVKYADALIEELKK